MKENIEQLAKEVAEQTKYRGIVGIHTGFVLGYSKCLEVNRFTEGDVIHFKDWCMNIPLGSELVGKTTNELFDIWIKQR